MNDPSITKLTGKLPGKTVAIFAGVHGNEKAGIMTVQKFLRSAKLSSGTAYVVIANPPAVAKGVRQIDKNLNRCFFESNNGQSWEDIRARELMILLDNCDALLDLHGYNGPEDEPFVITNDEGLALAARLNVKHVVTGINAVGDGATDCYMAEQKKVGICLECGSNYRPEMYVPFTIVAVNQFLAFHGLTKNETTSTKKLPDQTVYAVDQIVKRKTADFTFSQPCQNFDQLAVGKVFARDGETTYIAKQNQYIIFPRPDQKIGEEVFILLDKK